MLAVALAAMLLLVGAAMAVPPTRDAILRAIGLRGVSIERVPRLAPLPPGARTGITLGIGRPIPLARAGRAAAFTALLPPHASGAYIAHDVPGGRVSILVGRVLITEFRGTAQPFIFKVIDPRTNVTITRVNGAQGVYLSGAPHQVLFGTSNGVIRSDRVRLAGNVLIWQQGPLIVRIEGTAHPRPGACARPLVAEERLASGKVALEPGRAVAHVVVSEVPVERVRGGSTA